MIINNKFEDPYDKFPPADSIPFLSQPLVKSKLSNKFWKITKNIFESTLKEDFYKSDNTNTRNNGYSDIKYNNSINIKNKEYQDNQINDIINNIQNNKIDMNIINQKDNNNLNETDEKRIYIEKYKLLTLKNANFDKIISQQEEENQQLIKRLEQLENILSTKININNKNINHS